MREIKFRAWVGKMEYDVIVGRFGSFYVNPGVKGDGLDEKDSACLTPLNTKYPDTTPIMQFTGLHDKNGKEIWEGDVGRWYHISVGAVLSKIEWHYGAWHHFPEEKNKWLNWGPLAYLNPSTVEVLGNIYEHPHLLNREEKA